LVIAAFHEGTDQRFANNTIAAMVDKGWIVLPQVAIQRIIVLEQSVTNIEVRVAKMEMRVANIEVRLAKIEAILTALANHAGISIPP
jgi:hypothetical protein